MIDALENAGRIKEVILSPQCKIIGKQAFESCQFRKGIDFPATLIEIKKRAFAENHSLRQAIISTFRETHRGTMLPGM